MLKLKNAIMSMAIVSSLSVCSDENINVKDVEQKEPNYEEQGENNYNFQIALLNGRITIGCTGSPKNEYEGASDTLAAFPVNMNGLTSSQKRLYHTVVALKPLARKAMSFNQRDPKTIKSEKGRAKYRVKAEKMAEICDEVEILRHEYITLANGM